MAFEFEETPHAGARMKVIGVGGAGGNAVNGMISADLRGVEFIAVNTDRQALEGNKAFNKIQIGKNLTRGLGAGANPEIGARAVEEDKELIVNTLADADMVFITAGMGGGTGTGAAPTIAEIARDMGSLCIAIVTKPFQFEGAKRLKVADDGLDILRPKVDTLIVVPNQRLLSVVAKDTSLSSAFKLADDVLHQATKGISDLITETGLINLDFADVKTIMTNGGDAIMGTGSASGENRAVEAAQQAISSPLLEDISIAGALGVLVNITGGKDLTLYEVNDATSVINDAAGSNANIILGAVIDDDCQGEIRVTVVATGFNKAQTQKVGNLEDKFVSFIKPSMKDRERPAYERRAENVKNIELYKPGQKDKDAKRPSFTQDDLDIPTFLRKQMD